MKRLVKGCKAILDFLGQPVERVVLARSGLGIRRYLERKYNLSPMSGWYHWLAALAPHKVPVVIDKCNRRSQ